MKHSLFSAKSYYHDLLEHIRLICEENKVDSTHGFEHAVKIGKETEKALISENNFNVDDPFFENIILAGYLHDLDDRKYFKTVNYSNAISVLQKIPVDPQNIGKIVKMIDLVSFSKNGNSISSELPSLYYLPRYIDRIEAIGIFGLYRSYLFNSQKKIPVPLFSASTPKPLSIQQAFQFGEGKDIQYMKSGFSKTVVDHFFDKFIHIKLPKQITNPYLQQLYQDKLMEMIGFVIENAKTNYIHYEQNLLKAYQAEQQQCTND